jgi:hypothetical protein
LSPGISTVVEACSSIKAGPAILFPASSAAREYVGVATKRLPKYALRLPVKAVRGGAEEPLRIF